ncbi:MAG: UPF0149 family protein [Thiohalomonadaceae bacterium]
MSKTIEPDGMSLLKLAEFFDAEQRPDDCLMFDELDGFLTALACTPESRHAEQWLDEIWGEEGAGFADDAEEQEIIGLIFAWLNMIKDRLFHESEFEPLWHIEIDDNDNETIEPDGWCRGFMLAVDLHFDYWEQFFNREEDIPLLFPITFFAMRDMPGSEPDPMIAEIEGNQQIIDDFIKIIPQVVQGFYELIEQDGRELH